MTWTLLIDEAMQAATERISFPVEFPREVHARRSPQPGPPRWDVWAAYSAGRFWCHEAGVSRRALGRVLRRARRDWVPAHTTWMRDKRTAPAGAEATR
jgi:hypothetical protein